MKLPEGYEQPDSGRYIPEELRSYYEAQTPVPFRQVQKILEGYAKQIVAQRINNQEVLDYWAEVDLIVAAGDAEEALHLHYLSSAAEQQQRAEAYEIKKARQLEASRCPICDTITLPDPANKVKRRSLLLDPVQLIAQPGDYLSCLKCYLVAVHINTAAAAVDKIGKQSRLDLVKRSVS